MQTKQQGYRLRTIRLYTTKIAILYMEARHLCKARAARHH
jgi:hypothetical protein